MAARGRRAHASRKVKGQHLPPRVELLVAWSRLFKSAATYANYVGYVRTGCYVAGVSAAATYDERVARAKIALQKAHGDRRAKKFIQMDMVQRLVQAATAQGDVESAMLYLASYAFLLRVPSEAIPMTTGYVGESPGIDFVLGVAREVNARQRCAACAGSHNGRGIGTRPGRRRTPSITRRS